MPGTSLTERLDTFRRKRVKSTNCSIEKAIVQRALKAETELPQFCSASIFSKKPPCVPPGDGKKQDEGARMKEGAERRISWGISL